MVYLGGIITINVSLLRQFSAPCVSFVCHKLQVNHFCDYLMPHLYHLFCFVVNFKLIMSTSTVCHIVEICIKFFCAISDPIDILIGITITYKMR